MMKESLPVQILLAVVLLFSACSSTRDNGKASTDVVASQKEQNLTEAQVVFNFGLAAYQDSDYENAFSKWLPLAKKGHAEAAFRIADMYDYAQGVQQDYQESAKWFLVAAERGHGEAQFRIAGRLDSGTGLTKNISQAYKWYWLCRDNESTSQRSRYWADLYMRTKFSVGLLSSSQINQIATEVKQWKPKPAIQ